MSKISVGRLRVLAAEQIYEFGPGGDLSAELKVISDAFWVRLLLLGDLVRQSKIAANAGICGSIHDRRCRLQRLGGSLQGATLRKYF